MKSILIADGDERIARMFAQIFAGHDWSVTRYSDGQRASEAWQRPLRRGARGVSIRGHGRRGSDHADSRARPPPRRAPIVMVTGTVDCAVVGAALAAGADDVLYKPTDVAIVVATVNKCVERRRKA